MTFSPGPASFIRGPKSASPSNTRGGSRVPEWGPLGSVRGALSNERPYRDLRNVVANYPFERSHRFPVNEPNSGCRDYSRSSCSGLVPGSRRELTSRAVANSTSCFSLKVVSCRRQAPTHAGIFVSAAGWLMIGRIKSSARRRRPRRKISATSLPSHITPIVKPNIRDSTTTPELGSQ
jgi:hypothetical protein